MGQIKNIKLHIVTDIKVRTLTANTIHGLKELIAFRSGVACDDQVLTFAGRPLLDDNTLTEGDVNEASTPFLGERLLGGKVLGSLARAGKVKGQTPKVDAQEKKKPKTGRAKRRTQYNNRFVN